MSTSLRIHSENLDISIESNDTFTCDQALRVNAIISLLSGLDKKPFVEADPISGENAFDDLLNRILEEVHSIAKRSGWQ